MRNKVFTAIDKSKSYRVHIANMTDIVEESRKLHMTTPLATAALGRVLIATALMSLDLKSEENSISVILQGDGPAKQILATAYGDGRVKGYISNPDVELPLSENGKLNVGKAIGNGQLFVTKDLGLKEPYVGSIELISGEVAEDLTSYFLQSEQKATSVALGVKIDVDQRVKAAGGMIIEVLPGAKDEAIDALEELIGGMSHITGYVEKALEQGGTQEDVIKALADLIFENINEEFKPELLEFREVELKCDCNRDRIEKAFITIGKEEIENILHEDEKAEMSCHFCNKKYYFDDKDIKEILDSL